MSDLINDRLFGLTLAAILFGTLILNAASF